MEEIDNKTASYDDSCEQCMKYLHDKGVNTATIQLAMKEKTDPTVLMEFLSGLLRPDGIEDQDLKRCEKYLNKKGVSTDLIRIAVRTSGNPKELLMALIRFVLYLIQYEINNPS